jgi:1,4-alpha-glucan branching enzyme
VPKPGYYRELLNSDAEQYGGSGLGNEGGKHTHDWDNPRWPYALSLTLPPLSVMVFKLNS